MDINSLLSPSESTPNGGRSTPPPAATASSPHKTVRRTKNSPHKKSSTSSPLSQSALPPSSLAHQILQDPSPTSSPRSFNTTTPPDLPLATKSLTTGMDTLADLASMQHHQPSRRPAPLIRNRESYESQLSPSTLYPNANPMAVKSSTPLSQFDVNMSDTPKVTPTRDFNNTSISPENQQLASQLFTYLQENPHAYDSHVRYINILHQGLVQHVYPPNSPETHGDPRTYDLLGDLRTAREFMDKMFAIGEDLWADWIQDESMLAQSVDERLAVMDLCSRSVEEEYGSTKLWVIFGDWMLYLHESAMQDGDTNVPGAWSEDDKVIGREVFKWDFVKNIWSKGADETMWRMNDGHLVWDRYMDLILKDLSKAPTNEGALQVKAMMETRLQIPHATWDQTSQTYSTFISTYFSRDYEGIMVAANQAAYQGKVDYEARDMFEMRLRNAAASGNKDAEWTIFSEYLDWELAQPYKKRLFRYELTEALYQRALLRFPSDASLWEDYVVFLVEQAPYRRQQTSLIPVLSRATRHCPWSGSLWSQYLLLSEKEGQPFAETEQVKHKATKTGLLDASGMGEVLKVQTAWCSYLRRRAFHAGATDEDLDIAEMGIRSAMEELQQLGEKKYGAEYQGDPHFRLERIYIKYLTESGSWDSAREKYKGLAEGRGNSYEFWLRYYTWEMIAWGKFIQGSESVAVNVEAPGKTPTPSYATGVLKQALKREDLDWPEKIMEQYISHCEDHEEIDELQLAKVQVQRLTKALLKRREGEAAAAAAQQTHEAEAAAAAAAVNKRKREDEGVLPTTEESASKKIKSEPDSVANTSIPNAPPAVKRDRENATVMVRNLPLSASEAKVRQFFRDCGVINSVKLMPSGRGATAVMEFDTKEDALTALTKDQKILEENTIEVSIGSGTTLWVTNFPPTADEGCIRDLFSEYGEIIDIRFPSLKYNTHRRFCYVQFKTSAQAHAATARDGQEVGENLHLVAKISDPSKKHERSGPTEEGREIHISNLDWKATEGDLKELFSQYGEVQTARIPTKVSGGSKGFAFVVFSSKEEAESALAMNEQEFRSRPLHVKMSVPAAQKRANATVLATANGSSSASPRPSLEPNGDGTASSLADRNARTIALMNVPDTVNDSRIQALASPFGSLVKIKLQPHHSGAILEYANVADAGKASMALEGAEIAPGRKVRVGTVAELREMRGEVKNDRETHQTKQTTKQTTTPALLQASGPIRRPAQAGRRGGLGVKRGGAIAAGAAKKASATHATNNDVDGKEKEKGMEKGEGKGKSNDDFRAFLGKA